MKNPIIGLTMMVFVLGILSVPGVLATDYTCNSCSDCETKINDSSSGDRVLLTQDVINVTGIDPTGECILWTNENNVTFDGQGYMMSLNLSNGSRYGIKFQNSGGNATIRNVSLHYWNTASISFTACSNTNNLIEHVDIYSATALYFQGKFSPPTTCGATVRHSTIMGDISYAKGDNTTFYNNTLQASSGASYVIYVIDAGADNHLFYNNTFINDTGGYVAGTSFGSTVRFNDSAYGNYWTDVNGTGFSDGCTDADKDMFCDTDFQVQGSIYDYLPLSNEILPTYSEFSSDPETTNFTAEADLTNVTDPVLANDYAKIEWSGSGYDVAGKDLDDAIGFSTNLVSVNVTDIPTFNNTATVTLKGVSYAGADQYRVLKDGSLCTDCVKISHSPATFTVTGFSDYSTEYVPALEQEPILGVIPIVIAAAMLLLIVGSLLAKEIDVIRIVTASVILMIAIVFIGVLYVV